MAETLTNQRYSMTRVTPGLDGVSFMGCSEIVQSRTDRRRCNSAGPIAIEGYVSQTLGTVRKYNLPLGVPYPLLGRLEQFDESANVRVAQHHGAAVLYFHDPAIGNGYGAGRLCLCVNRFQVVHLKADVVDPGIGEVLVRSWLVSILRRPE